jgi:hypothetical protein
MLDVAVRLLQVRERFFRLHAVFSVWFSCYGWS